VFGIFKFLYAKKNKVKRMKGEILKIYHAIAGFYKVTIIPMVRWSFICAGLGLNPDHPFTPLTMNPEIVLE
jgi:hypothetical protein